MKDHKSIILETIGLILLITGALLAIVAIIAMSYKADILLGIMLLGLFITVLGALISLRYKSYEKEENHCKRDT